MNFSQKDETKTCADINRAAANTRGDFPDWQANTWRYNDVGALRFDRASAQYALNKANFLADATTDRMCAAEDRVQLFIVGGVDVQFEQHLLHGFEVLAGLLEKHLIELAQVNAVADVVAVCRLTHVCPLLNRCSWAEQPYTTPQEKEDELKKNPRWTPRFSSPMYASVSVHYFGHATREAAQALLRMSLWPAAKAIWSSGASGPQSAEAQRAGQAQALLVVREPAVARQPRVEVAGAAGQVVGRQRVGIAGDARHALGRRAAGGGGGVARVGRGRAGGRTPAAGERPLSQRTVLKPSSSSWRSKSAPLTAQPKLPAWLRSPIRKATRGSVLPARSL